MLFSVQFRKQTVLILASVDTESLCHYEYFGWCHTNWINLIFFISQLVMHSHFSCHMIPCSTKPCYLCPFFLPACLKDPFWLSPCAPSDLLMTNSCFQLPLNTLKARACLTSSPASTDLAPDAYIQYLLPLGWYFFSLFILHLLTLIN